MDAHAVSVVMAVYNSGDALADSLSSVLSQAGCQVEVIAVDDGSTDGSGSVLDEWAARDPRVRVIHQQNQGLTSALINGCGQARGEFIARQDVGDASLPGRLAAQAALLEARPELAFVGCAHELVGPAGEPLSDTEQPDADQPLRNRDGRRLRAPHHGSVMFRKSAYEAAGGYRREFYFAQDFDLWMRMIEVGDIDYLTAVGYRVKFDLDSITSRHRDAQQALRALALAAQRARAAGQSEAPILEQAQAIRPQRQGTSPDARARAAAAYFVGSCLARRGDPRARQYFAQALNHRPWHLKSWFRWLASWARAGSNTQ